MEAVTPSPPSSFRSLVFAVVSVAFLVVVVLYEFGILVD
jgi:hypothetical protein